MLRSAFLFQKLFQSLLLLCISELNVLYCRRFIIVAHFQEMSSEL